MEYGLQVFNSSGAMMFDSSNPLSSYVVTRAGVATSISLTGKEILFVRADPSIQISSGGTAVANFVVENANGQGFPTSSTQTFNFYRWFSNNDTKYSVSLDYFVIQKASEISSTDDYGLVIYNDDESIQFDSRSVGSNHFQITDSHTYPDIRHDYDLAPRSQYISVSDTSSTWPSTWTFYDPSPTDLGMEASYFFYTSSLTVRAASVAVVNTTGQAGNEEDNRSGSNPFGDEYLSTQGRIGQIILTGELL